MLIEQVPDQRRRNLTILLAANVVLGVVGFATSTISSRMLGTVGRGELAAIQNIPNLLAAFAALGAGEAALYLVARHPRAARPITLRAIRIAAVGGCAGALIGWFVLPLVLDDSGTITSARMILPLVAVVPLYLASYQTLRALGRPGLWSAFRIVSACSWLAILGVSVVADYSSPRGLAIAFAVAQGLLALVAVGLVRWYDDRDTAPAQTTRRLLRYGIPSSLVTLPQTLNLRLDQVLLASAVPRSQLGIYVAGVSWSWVVAPPFQAFAQWLLPRLAGLEPVEAIERARKSAWLGLGMTVVVAVIAVPVTGVLFDLVMGDDFEAGTRTAQILVVAGAVSGLMVVLEEIHRGLGRPTVVLGAEIAGLAITVVLLVLLVPRHGIAGAAWASVSAYSLICAVLALALWRTTRRPASAG